MAAMEQPRFLSTPARLLLLGAVLFVFLACNLPTSGPATRQAEPTQQALSVEATRLASGGAAAANPTQAATPDQRATEASLQTQVAVGIAGTLQAQQTATKAAQPTATNTSTQAPILPSATQTLVLPSATQAPALLADTQAATETPTVTATTAPPTNTPEPPTNTPEPPTQTPEPTQGISFEEWLESANILLFEDMADAPDTSRYVKKALDNLGLSYVDVKDALGQYKEQLLSGGPGGNGWDLIISAKETRSDVSGEFYVYLNDALDAGSSVIIEEYDLDEIGAGKISTILDRCGVAYQDDWPFAATSEQVLWAFNTDHPIHNTPNSGIKLSNPTNYWLLELGDFLTIEDASNAVMLWGQRPKATSGYAVAVACLDNQLILQTYATHNYGMDRVVKMWQNYIYNALQARYERTN